MSQFSPVSIWMSLNYLSRHITLFLTSAGNTLWMMALLCYIHLIVTWWGHSWILGHRATRQYDISYVLKSLINISLSTIPSTKAWNRNPTWLFDPFLSLLCWRSHVAYWEWKAAGCPRSGQVYENRKKCKREVASYLTKCRARIEYINIQKCDESFASKNCRHFRSHPSAPNLKACPFLLMAPL